MLRAPFALAALLAVTLPVVLATHEQGCVPDQETTLFFVDTAPAAPLGAHYYVDLRFPPLGPIFELWIYEESNGLEGLQRADEIIESETCGHPADTIIY